MKRKYKQYLDHGDIGITKRTSRRHNLNCDNYLRNLGDMETEKANNLQRNISNEFIDEAPSIAFNEENHGNDNVDANYDNNDSERDVSFDNLSNMMDDVDDRESDIAFHNLSNIMDDVDDRERDIAFDNLRKIIDDVNIEQNNDLYLKPQSLETFINSKEFFEKITTRVDKSAGEIFLMLLKYSFNNTLCTTARTNLFKLINNIFESPILPESKYMTDKLLNPASECEYHAVCLHCSAYLGEFGSNELKDICDNCKHNVIVQNPSDESFFVLIDPSKQISDLLTINDEYYDHVTKTRIFEPASPIRDVYDGNLYRQFINSLSAEERCSYVTFVFNTDGASKFKCSKRSVWPIYLMLNELPKQERMKNLICCGLWFNRKKPDMTIFLDKFVDLMTKLKNKGILCKIKNEERVIKPYIISCCVDSVARAPVQGIKQFNGHFGCNWCLHPGVYHGTIVYSLMRNVVESRNHIDTVQRMLNFDTENPDFGIMYPSPFINLPAFDIIKSFIPDYMHCCLEGVAKQMLTYYINPLTDDEIGVLDSKMDKISAPHQVGRLTRRISCRDDWKAREWENFVLFYSTPILSSVLTKTQLDHWLLFVESLYILLQDSIYIKDLDRADDMLHRFVSKTEELYGIRAMTFNMHLLLHISRSVFNWGPLFVNSTFCFESANRYILNAIKCSKGVPQQVVRYVNLGHTLLVTEDKVINKADNAVVRYCNDILASRVSNTCKLSEIIYFGKEKSIQDYLLEQLNLSINSLMYFKMVKDGCLFEGKKEHKKRSDNSFALLTDQSFIRISRFIVDKERRKELTICHEIRTRSCFQSQYKHLRIVDSISNDQIVIETKNIKKNMYIYENFWHYVPLPTS